MNFVRRTGEAVPHSATLGALAEDRAADFLLGRGCIIVSRNFRCRTGEIDIVCLDEGTLAFVEVRARTSSRYGGAAASVTPAKQRRIMRSAQFWLQKHPEWSLPCRFDVLAAERSEGLNWIKHAFICPSA